MAVTKADNQHLTLKNKVKKFYQVTKSCMHQKGSCPVKDILAPSTEKWSLFAMYNLAFTGVMRFNELKSRIKGISPRMLSVTLKKLEEGGIVSRKIYPVVPPKVEYELTKFGYDYADRLIDLNLWLFEQSKK
jgi:DNA-binding HxlR family transcriptional regulator